MSGQDTIEIDPNQLSQDVVDELVEDNVMDEEQAKNTGEKIWLNEVTEKEPEKVGFSQYIRSWCGTAIKFSSKIKNKIIESVGKLKNITKNKIDNLRTDQTIFAEVISVTPDQESNKVCLKLSHNNIGIFKIKLDPKSTEMSNLLEYKSSESPKDLEGEKITISNSKDLNYNSTEIIIPHNVSFSGRIRYKLYSYSKELFEKTRISSIYIGSINDLFFLHAVLGVATGFIFTFGQSVVSGSIISTLIGSVFMIPFVLWASVFGFTIIHSLFTFLNFVASAILHSDYYHIEEC